VRAPSAGNVQPWHFYAVRDAHLRQALAAAAFGQSFVAQAPLVIVVCADADRSATRYGDRGRTLYCFQDTAAAITNMPHRRGLGVGHLLDWCVRRDFGGGGAGSAR
jgi:nitroreductase